MNFGLWEIVIILFVGAIIFGAGKLPTVMGDLAKGIRNFTSGMRDPAEQPAHKPPAASDERSPPAV